MTGRHGIYHMQQLDPTRAIPADDRAIGVLCGQRGWTVVVRERTGWSIIGDVPAIVIFVHCEASHFTALDVGDRERAGAMVKRWPERANFDDLELRPVATPGERQMCFGDAAGGGAATWGGGAPPTGRAWVAAATALKRETWEAVKNNGLCR